MIRTVKIPTKVSRMGCAPGSGCCDECGTHTGPPIGDPSGHVHMIPSARNTTLKATLGTVNCDQDGNCYDDSTGDFTTPASRAGGGSTASNMGLGGMSNTTLFLVGAAVLIGLLEVTSRRR